mmetsp:Transcript_47978/g.145964  ORF Transcript_47978/g.145964 Transcript_47978/m.145964 type:complete len:294 (-) Transcript_47978:1697-2578(-)
MPSPLVWFTRCASLTCSAHSAGQPSAACTWKRAGSSAAACCLKSALTPAAKKSMPLRRKNSIAKAVPTVLLKLAICTKEAGCIFAPRSASAAPQPKAAATPHPKGRAGPSAVGRMTATLTPRTPRCAAKRASAPRWSRNLRKIAPSFARRMPATPSASDVSPRADSQAAAQVTQPSSDTKALSPTRCTSSSAKSALGKTSRITAAASAVGFSSSPQNGPPWPHASRTVCQMKPLSAFSCMACSRARSALTAQNGSMSSVANSAGSGSHTSWVRIRAATSYHGRVAGENGVPGS